MAVVEVPEATISRLPIYFRVLADLSDRREVSVSSERISEFAGVNAATVRKDFSYLGSYGTRGVGYEVAVLLSQIGSRLGMARSWPVVIAGAGNLGQALANYRGFSERGFPVLALIEVDESKVGTSVHGVQARAATDLDQIVSENEGCIGVVATPA
ncbi:MAG: redox-sensing transcriptional repressor Rex, partial [Acidimicrobiales bacterium]